jgi:hypothetical protein
MILRCEPNIKKKKEERGNFMKLHRSIVAAIALGCAFAASVPAASPFAGKWKLNAAKSKLTGTTDSVAAAGTNTWKFTYGSYSWTVKADGTDQPTPFGSTVALKALSATKWQLTDKAKGRVTATETWELASDGKSMTRASAGTHEDGTAFNDVVTVTRTAGDKGFEGTWESTEVKTSFSEVDIEGSDTGLVATVPADKTKLTLTFDGKDNPIEGPKVPAGFTISGKLSGPRKVEATSKAAGKVLDTETWEVSADGKTFTYTEKDAGESKAQVSVFDKM